jgi:NADH-quinone oxidoreductase subunit F
MRLESVDALRSLGQQAQNRLSDNESKIQVKVHLGTCGISSGAGKVLDAFLQEVNTRHLSEVLVLRAACIGLCGVEPTVTVIPPGKPKVIYQEVTVDKVPGIVERHLIGGQPVAEWIIPQDSPRMSLQEIRVMHNQDLDPDNIEEYLARAGYQGLAKALTQMSPEQVIEEVKKSGVRGRGGAGFPTAIKWGFVRSAPGDEKYIACNGDEGDPGAYMNRAELEGNPHAVIEGMSIGAYAIGNVKKGYAYIRAEYPLAIETFNHALAQAREYGLLGKNILGTGFEFDIEVFPGAGAFVCGEETALLISIEGRRGNPRQRPPFPANKGLFGKPTVLNNVETWSDIPLIIVNGAEWFASVGNERSKGTKTLCLVGKIRDTGLVEVPLGTPLGKILFDIGGGIPGGKKFKAVQLGGPSGGVIPIGHLNTPIDYESVAALGAIMGSGGVVVMDEDSCMVDVAKYFLQFTKDESCGKCTPCRAGIPAMLDILTRITRGEGKMEDLDTLRTLGEALASTSLCGLGQTSPNPVLTTIRHFPEEYEAHIIDKKCPAAVCQALFRAPCQHTCPVELDVPGYISLIKEGKFADSYSLIKQRNPFPSVCGRICTHPCEFKCRRGQVDEPLAIRDLKRFAADWASQHKFQYQPEMKEKRKEKVGIIGAGPAGLSAAWDLAIEGYPVTVFEALQVAGGMLAVGIPEYRLPKAVLRKEVEEVTRLGVEIKLNSPVTDAEALLNEGFQAVFIATGAHQGDKMGAPGEDLAGVHDAVDFLKAVNLGQPVAMGKRVAVVGGGNSAIDAARVAVRKGAKEVIIIYRRERKDMPASEEEIEAAEAEGVAMHTLTNPVEVIGSNGKVAGLKCVRMQLGEFDRSGRRTPSPVAGSEYELPVDTVIKAIGQRADTSFIKNGHIQLARGGTIAVGARTLATGCPGIFAGGDAVTGPATAIEAIAAGQRAASSIRRYLEGRKLTPRVERNGYKPIDVSRVAPTDEETSEKARIRAGELSASGRKGSFTEVARPYGVKQAREEASRCLRCDISTE